MRIVSLLPSATEIVCAVGGRSELVGVSHECDHPVDVARLPILTRSKIVSSRSSADIDRDVREVIREALAVYDIDVEKLREVRPDVIVTQDLCEVCAVSLDDVRSAVARLASSEVEIVSLRPTRLVDIWSDIERVAQAIGRASLGRSVVEQLQARVEELAQRVKRFGRAPRVLTIEWIEPVMLGGVWMPELIELLGGECLGVQPGQAAPTLERDELAEFDPDVVLIKPCGFTLERTQSELPVLRRSLPWEEWRAIRAEGLWLADGNAFFNRPGPRIVESLEILALCMYPDELSDLALRHQNDVVAIKHDLSIERMLTRYPIRPT